MQRPYRLVIFDYDGTLADSYPWLMGAMNEVGARFGVRPVSATEVEAFRGLEVRHVMNALKVPRWRVPMIVLALQQRAAHAGDEIPLFAGVPEMLAVLHEAGVVLAVVSSNTEENIRARLGDQAGLVNYYNCGASVFGKAKKLRQVLQVAGVPGRAAVYVGDERRDGQAAREAGIDFAAVTWGYAPEAALLKERPVRVFRSVGQLVKQLVGS